MLQASEAAAQLQARKRTASLLRKPGQLIGILGWPQEVEGCQEGRLGKEEVGRKADSQAPYQSCLAPRVQRERTRPSVCGFKGPERGKLQG